MGVIIIQIKVVLGEIIGIKEGVGRAGRKLLQWMEQDLKWLGAQKWCEPVEMLILRYLWIAFWVSIKFVIIYDNELWKMNKKETDMFQNF